MFNTFFRKKYLKDLKHQIDFIYLVIQTFSIQRAKIGDSWHTAVTANHRILIKIRLSIGACIKQVDPPSVVWRVETPVVWW